MSGYDIIVIGGGSGGLVVAVGAAQLGARVAVVEKKALGGDCLYTGCVPSKTLIRSARFAADVKRAASLGFASVPLQFADGDFASITGRVERVIETVGAHDAPEVFRKQGVEIIFGTPRFLSPHELEIEQTAEQARASSSSSGDDDGRAAGGKLKLSARRFCISKGSRPAAPPVAGLNEAGFLTNEEVFRLKTLPRRLVVLGAGPIGLELGQSFARFGSDVTIVEMGERVLPKEDEEVSETLGVLLRAEGIRILLNAKAVRAGSNDRGKTLVLECRGESGQTTTEELRADEILVAAGRKPNVENLNLEAAGVEYDERRIITDEYLRTTQKHIFAAGDVTGHFPFTHMAAYEASIVIRNALLFFPLLKKTDFRVVPWATYTDPEVARVGMTQREARERYGDANIRIYRTAFADNDRAQAEEAPHGFMKFVCTRRNQILGAHIVGAHAGELIHEIVLAMNERLPVTKLGAMIHVYPTLTQVNQRAGLDAVLAKLTTPAVKKILAWYLARWR
ncbi:MAG: dihydrolipoyl dehydrogenase family protein [Pyrinomonadaceae bacterium]